MSLLVAVAFVVLWSSGFVGAELADDSGPASGMLAWRYLATAGLLLAVWWRGVRRMARREVAQQAALGLLAHVAFLGGVFGATAAGVDAGTSALVTALQPMLVVAAGWAWWHDRVGPQQGLGLGLGLLAVGLTVGAAGLAVGPAVLLPVVSVAGLSGAALLERRWQPATPVGPALTVQVAVAALAFTSFSTWCGTPADVDPSRDTLAALAWLVVLSGLGGYGVFLLSLRRLGATTTSTLLYLTPPTTTVWAWLMFGDAPAATQVGGLVLGGVAVGLAVTARRSVPAAQ